VAVAALGSGDIMTKSHTRLRDRKALFLLAVSFFMFLKFTGYRLLLNLDDKSQDVLSEPATATYGTQRYSGRHLLTVAWEKCDFEIGRARNYSDPSSWNTPTKAYYWVPLYVVLIIVIFVAMAVVCDDFFVPSLEAISEKLDLSEDVAGATFMAAGSSAPELFTSIAGVSTESDVGVGTIVGSAVFNLLCIIALSAAFSGGDLNLDWRPLTRDSIFYATSICLFVAFSYDGQFTWVEALVMLLFYVLYIVIMKFNPQLMQFMSRFGKKRKVRPSLAPVNGENKIDLPTADNLPQEDGEGDIEMKKRKFSHKQKANPDGTDEVDADVGSDAGSKSSHHSVDDDDDDDGGDYVVALCPWCPPVAFDVPKKNRRGCRGVPRQILAWTLFLMALPFVILFTWTIPDCSTPKNRKWYLFSFIMSIAWIAALSFGTVTLVGRAGCILEIDKFTMGLVVIAIGTSIPDAMSSILVARDGFGDMAVSNAIGSNVFDIDLGIGLPFLITILINKGSPIHLLSASEMNEFESGGYPFLPHVKFGIILLLILTVCITIFAVSKFKLTRKLGLSFLIIYVLFVAYAYVQDIYCDGWRC